MMIVERNGPTIDRSLTLRFKADWGQANITRICGWLAQEFSDRAGPDSRWAIWNGRGGADALHAVGRGEVDIAVCTPAVFATMAVLGVGPFESNAYPDLRSLGVLPQDDRMVVALDATLGIATFQEFRERRPPLRIAASPDDGVNFVGLATHALMAAAGIGDETFRSWGGIYVEDERPFPCIGRYASGEVDGVIHEAIMAPHWSWALDGRKTVILPVEDEVLGALGERYGWHASTIEPRRLPGVDVAVPTLDFRDFVVVVRADMPEDVAHLLTWCMVETRSALERQYMHFPPERSPVGHPLDPFAMAQSPIPLHDGATAHYEAIGARS